jgi:2-hydroxychromene-2-carboxylate isomerase
MASPEPIDFWFTMGSTYSYLTVMRLPEIEEAAEIPFRWRPFHLLTILQEMKHVPFADKPAKLAYMWRDIERRAGMYGIPLRVPAPYPPKQSVVANRVAILGLEEGWGVAFIRVAYRRWLQLGQESGVEPNLSESLKEIGQDPDRVLALAGGAAVAERLDAETSRARELGIFGSPTFAIGRELFWGDDRLDDAIRWYHNQTVEAPRGRRGGQAAR